MPDFSDYREIERYAAAVRRATSLAPASVEDELEVADARLYLERLGLDGELVRFIDDEGGLSAVRWKLRISTRRGAVELTMDKASDWKRELVEAGFAKERELEDG